MSRIPARYAGVVMPFFLSIIMTCVISLVSTLRGIGVPPNFVHVWMGAWGASWVVAFPTLLGVLPLVRKLTAVVVRAG